MKNQEVMPTTEVVKKLRKIMDPDEYFRALVKYKDRYLICAAVKDTFYQIPANTGELLVDLGMEDLHLPEGNVFPRGWQGYLFAINKGSVILNKLAEVQMALTEYLEIEGISIRLVSKPYHSGNVAKIILDGYDLSVNGRGLNIVVFEVESRMIIDSVCFDFYRPEKNRKVCTRWNNFSENSLPNLRLGDLYKEDDNAIDIDDELDDIIVKYRLDEYYPRYTYRRRSMKAIRNLANTWGRHESIACVIVWKNYQNALKDRDYFLAGLSEEQKDLVSFIFVQFKGGASTNSYVLSGKCLDYAILERTVWKSFDHVYTISNIGDNYLGLWFRQRSIAYVNLYKYLESYGIVGIGTNETYYSFVSDKREFSFSDRTTECSPMYWEIYEEKEQYMASKSPAMQLTSAKKIFFLALTIKNFIYAKEWLDNICNLTENNERYKCAWDEIIALIEAIKSQIQTRNQRDVVSIWIDQVQYTVAMEHMPFIASLREKSIWFDNMFNIVSFTRETLRTLYTGKKLIDDKTNDISNLNVLTSPLANYLFSSGYSMYIYGGYHQELFPESLKPHNHFFLSNPASDMLWGVLRNLIKNKNRSYSHVHILGEVHEPYINTGINDKNLSDWLRRKYFGCESVDKQIKFYLNLMGKNMTSFIFSDHGQHYFGVQNHVLFLVYGSMYRFRKISGIFSMLDFGKIVMQILQNGDVQEKGLEREYAEIQGTTILRGGKFASKEGVVQEAIPAIYPIFRGYRGIVTKDYIYVHIAGGREWLSRRSCLQPELSWYERSDDIYEKKLLLEMREKANIDYGNEPPDYGPQSEFYLSVKQKISENKKYNELKIILVNELFSKVTDKSVALYLESRASRELFLMLSASNRKKIIGVMDNAPKKIRVRATNFFAFADLNIPVFSVSEAAQRGVRYIITTSRIEEAELKKYISETDYPLHVWGIYGWFALNGYYTKFNFWEFAIESMDMKPATKYAVPCFFHHASPKAHKIALVLLTQNDEATICSCLYRMLGDISQPLRIYCLDLNSQDRTAELISGYSKIDGSISIEVLGREAPHVALNRILDSLEEKYVMFLSPKARLHPAAISYLSSVAEYVQSDVASSWAAPEDSEAGKALLKQMETGTCDLALKAELLDAAPQKRYEEWLSQDVSSFHGLQLYRMDFLRSRGIRFLADDREGLDSLFLQAVLLAPQHIKTESCICVYGKDEGGRKAEKEALAQRYEANRRALNRYRLWHHALPLLPEFKEQPILAVPLGGDVYYYIDKSKNIIVGTFIIPYTDKVQHSFFRDLTRPLLVKEELNLCHWAYLYQNVRDSEDFGEDNHVYLYYKTLEEFLVLLQVRDITPYLEKEKMVFLFGDRDLAENYPLNFGSMYHISYGGRKKSCLGDSGRLDPENCWDKVKSSDFEDWLFTNHREILASKDFRLKDLAVLYGLYVDGQYGAQSSGGIADVEAGTE